MPTNAPELTRSERWRLGWLLTVTQALSLGTVWLFADLILRVKRGTSHGVEAPYYLMVAVPVWGVDAIASHAWLRAVSSRAGWVFLAMAFAAPLLLFSGGLLALVNALAG